MKTQETTQPGGEKGLIEQIADLQRQLDGCVEPQEPMVVSIGTMKNDKDIVDWLTSVRISPDHLLYLSKLFLDSMWEEMDLGTPCADRAQIIKDIHTDIHEMYELASVAKYLRARRKLRNN